MGEKEVEMGDRRLVQLVSEEGSLEKDQRRKWPVQLEEILEKASGKEGQRQRDEE